MDYLKKYLKYKNKYLNLKHQTAGSAPNNSLISKTAGSAPNNLPISKSAGSAPNNLPISKSAGSAPNNSPTSKSAGSAPNNLPISKSTAFESSSEVAGGGSEVAGGGSEVAGGGSEVADLIYDGDIIINNLNYDTNGMIIINEINSSKRDKISEELDRKYHRISLNVEKFIKIKSKDFSITFYNKILIIMLEYNILILIKIKLINQIRLLNNFIYKNMGKESLETLLKNIVEQICEFIYRINIYYLSNIDFYRLLLNPDAQKILSRDNLSIEQQLISSLDYLNIPQKIIDIENEHSQLKKTLSIMSLFYDPDNNNVKNNFMKIYKNIIDTIIKTYNTPEFKGFTKIFNPNIFNYIFKTKIKKYYLKYINNISTTKDSSNKNSKASLIPTIEDSSNKNSKTTLTPSIENSSKTTLTPSIGNSSKPITKASLTPTIRNSPKVSPIESSKLSIEDIEEIGDENIDENIEDNIENKTVEEQQKSLYDFISKLAKTDLKYESTDYKKMTKEHDEIMKIFKYDKILIHRREIVDLLNRELNKLNITVILGDVYANSIAIKFISDETNTEIGHITFHSEYREYDKVGPYHLKLEINQIFSNMRFNSETKKIEFVNILIIIKKIGGSIKLITDAVSDVFEEIGEKLK
jgi:hypothetical protein